MHKNQIHQYKLRVSIKLKELLVAISGHRHRSVGSQVIETIKRIESQSAETITAPRELVDPPHSSISINFPADIFQGLKSAATLKKMSVNDEILDRIYWSNPLSELDYLVGKKNSTDYPKESISAQFQVQESPPTQTQGLCTQTEDERIMLEKYRSMSTQQRTQMQAISDAIHEPKKIALEK